MENINSEKGDINEKNPCCSLSDWMSVSNVKDAVMCKVHGCIFSNTQRCPMRINGQMIKKDMVPSEIISIAGQGIEQGVTMSDKGCSRVNSVDILSAAVRSHAFRFVIVLKDPKNWGVRRRILESKGFKVDPKAGIGRVFMVNFSGFKVWLADKSITIYFPKWKQYFVDEARFGYNFALADLRDLLNDLAVACDSDFVIDGAYHFKCSGQHHALIHNALAKMYNRNKEKLQVFDKNGELWLLIDDSHPDALRMNETEGVHKDTAPRDVDDIVKPFFNQLRETELLPKDILAMFEKIAKIQEESAKEASNVRSLIADIRDNALMPLKAQTDALTAQLSVHLPVERGARDALVEDVKIRREMLITLKAIKKNHTPSSSVCVSDSPLSHRRIRRISRSDRIQKYIKKYGW